ncbi:MAG: hypothetical protein JW789_05220 [Candidatus Aenigmarchaeota archaeon]|nr:hypothetical protein [Candidatus Aenigmarchaeota archaeon]
MTGATWKTRDETFHGSKWGYVVVALVIMILLSLLGSIFYLIGEGAKNAGVTSESVFTVSAATTGVIIILLVIALIAIKVGWLAMATFIVFFTKIHVFLSIFWVLFKNIYILVFTLIMIIALVIGLGISAYTNIEISLTNPLVIGLLIFLLILFFPLAIFIVDLFSYEHE